MTQTWIQHGIACHTWVLLGPLVSNPTLINIEFHGSPQASYPLIYSAANLGIPVEKVGYRGKTAAVTSPV